MRHSFSLIVAALGLCSTWPLLAQSLYQQKVEVPMGVEYESNPALTSPASSVSRWRVSPNYTLLRRDGADELHLKLGATLEQSSDTTLSRNRRDFDGDVQWQHEAERSVYVLRGGIAQSALRNTLLEETGQLVAADGTRTTRSLDASFTHEISPLYSLAGGANARWYRYTVGTVPDSRQIGANLELDRALQPGTSMFVAGSLSSYVPDQTIPTASSSVLRSINVGYRSRIPGDPWSWEVSGGAGSYSGPFSDTSVQAAAQVSYEGPRWNASLAYARRPVVDSLRGTFSPNQQLRVSAGYALTEFTRIGVDAAHNRTSGTAPGTTRSVGLQVSTELSPLWRLAVRLRHLQYERGTGSDAGTTVGGIVLTYSHPDF